MALESFDSEEDLIFDEKKQKSIFKSATCRWSICACVMLQVLVFVCLRLLLEVEEHPKDKVRVSEIADQVLGAMDFSVEPCEDFYRYACGRWLDSTELGEHSRISKSFGSIQAANTQLILEILQEDWPYIGTAFDLCMDTPGMNELGIFPIAQRYMAIDSATTKLQLFQAAAKAREAGIDTGVLFSAFVEPNPYTQTYQLTLWQSGLLLPQSYYSGDLSPYNEWLLSLFAAGPDSDLTADTAADILQFEQRLAQSMNSEAENTNPKAVQNTFSASEAAILLGDAFALVPSAAEINIAQPRYFSQLTRLLNETSFTTLQHYVKMHLFVQSFSQLGENQRAVMESFAELLYGRGSTNRTTECESIVLSLFPFLVGKYFSENADPAIKSEVEGIIDNIAESYAQLFSATWIDEQTRQGALLKLELLKKLVAYPEEWPDWATEYRGYDLSSYFNLITSVSAAQLRNELAKLGTPMTERWEMSSATVNAYYSPNSNSIVFPLAILTYPFFDLASPAALNYGGIGVVAGHEIGHAFDRSGSQFGASGELEEWWSDASLSEFNNRTQCLVEQFSRYRVGEVYLDGSLTVGENGADSGGISSAWRAFQRDEKKNKEEPEVRMVFNMTGEQLFFVSFAQVWCEKTSPIYAQMAAATDPHSPGKFRVLGTLSDSPQFRKTFKCKSNDKYFAEPMCLLWE